jgi:hypothetical protein
MARLPARMSLDLGAIATLTAALLDKLEIEYGELDGVQLRAVMLIVDIEALDEDGDTWTHVRWHFGERASNYDPARSSSAYAAGVVAEAFSGLTEGDR